MRRSLILIVCVASLACFPARAEERSCAPGPIVQRVTTTLPLENERVIRGHVKDAASDSPLEGVFVGIAGQQRGVRADLTGRFELALTPADSGQIVLRILRIAFEPKRDTVTVSATGGMTVNAFLTYQRFCLEGIEVSPDELLDHL